MSHGSDSLSTTSPLKREQPRDIEVPSAKASRVIGEQGIFPMCVFDIESTGLSTERDTIISIGAIRVEHFEHGGDLVPKVVHTYEALVQFSGLLDPFVANLVGYDESEWTESAVTIDVALKGFFPLWHHAEALCAWNLMFDWRMLEQAARQLKWQTPRRPTRPIDIMAMAWPLLVAGKVENLKLDTVARALDLLDDDRDVHRPLADAMLAYSVYREICPDLEALQDMWRRMGVEHFQSGGSHG